MSRSPFFFIENFDGYTNKYEMYHPLVWDFRHTKRVPAELFPYNGCHDLFSIVEDNAGDFPSMHGIHYGLPKDVSVEIKNIYNEHCYDIDEKHTYTPTAYWFTYADMYIYCLEHPEVPDYEAMNEAHYNNESVTKIMKPTPLIALKERVDAFLDVMGNGDSWKDDYSIIRIVYWIG